MEEIVFNNASRKIVGIFFWLTLIFACAAIVPQLVLHVQAARGAATQSVRDTCNLTSLLTLPLGLAMLLAALLTIPVARQTEQSFKAFREGDLLVRWEYDPVVWSRYIQTERARLSKIARWIYLLIFGPSGGIALFITWQVQATLHGKINACLIAIAAIFAGSMFYYAIVQWVIGVRINAMTGCPRAFVGRNAAYAGGMYNFWGSQLRRLQSARILPGATPADPHILELIIGFSPAAKTAVGAIDAINLLAFSPTYASSMIQRLAVLIPPGQEARAREIIAILLPARPPVASKTNPSHGPMPGPTTPIQAAKPTLPPAAAALARKSRRWGIATIVLLVGGLILLMIAGGKADDAPSGANGSSAAGALGIVGFFAWVAALLTFVVWIVQIVRARRAARI